jgi:hypothetical protein
MSENPVLVDLPTENSLGVQPALLHSWQWGDGVITMAMIVSVRAGR